MASFGPAPMIAASVVVANNPALRRGGGGGEPPEDDPFDDFWWFHGPLLALALIPLGIIFTLFFEEKLPAYIVQGTIAGYHIERESKQDRVFVDLLQSDGKVRSYSTGYKKGTCYYRVNGVRVDVQVNPTYNTLTKIANSHSSLMSNPCHKY